MAPRISYRYIALAGIASSAVILGSLAVFGLGADGWLHAARYTGRLSFHVFLMAFVADRMTPLSTAFMRTSIAAFCTMHLVHLVTLSTYVISTGAYPPLFGIALGGAAYALIAGSLIALIRRMPADRLIAATMHIAVLIFIVTYIMNALEGKKFAVCIYGASIAIAAWICRFALQRRSYGYSTASTSI